MNILLFLFSGWAMFSTEDVNNIDVVTLVLMKSLITQVVEFSVPYKQGYVWETGMLHVAGANEWISPSLRQ